MLILGIETSCDETAASVVRDGRHVLSNVIATSQEAHKNLGGVIPEEAARRQVECILPVIDEALRKADVEPQSLDAIAVTKGPGLLGSLLVGTTTARTLAMAWKKPLIGVHHTMGHLSSPWLDASRHPEEPRSQAGRLEGSIFPILSLSVSGGHTELWYRESHTKGTLLGATRDDACGEAFDKGAALLSLPYPGGPEIEKLAKDGNPKAFAFPLPLKNEDTVDFSFSGLKTSLKYLLQDLTKTLQTTNYKLQTRHIAASYQHALCMHLYDRLRKARALYPKVKEVHLVGGVAANHYLRNLLEEATRSPTPEGCGKSEGLLLRAPAKLSYCTDNAAMIAAAAFFMHQELGRRSYEAFETAASCRGIW